MFSILNKPQESVNAEDLETLQNEIEKRLAAVVTEKWKLEQELEALNNLSPETSEQSHFSSIGTAHASADSTNNNRSSNSLSNSQYPTGKLRNSLKSTSQPTADTIDVNSSDSTATIYLTNNGTTNISDNTKLDTESVSSEGSLTSNLTGSTIITGNLAEPGSHLYQSTSSTPVIGTNKRTLKNSTHDRPPKRFRPNGTSIHSHPKRLPQIKQQRAKCEESKPLKKQLIKNEAPDKLWPFVDQFCATPTEEQIKDLEKMIKDIEEDEDYYKFPSGVTKQQTVDSTSNSKDPKTPRKKSKGQGSLGTLTQRLVSSFIEESEDDTKFSGDDPSPSPARRSKTVSDVGNANNLEKNIRQQLEEYSILTKQDDIPYASEENESSRQLRAYQHELLTIQTQNRHYMQLLLRRAKKHIDLEKEREKLREASADVINVYQRLIQAKQKKKSPTKKEKDAAWKAVKVHEAIFKKCDELYLTNRLVVGHRDFPDL